jgi:hypothetical protein
MALESTAKSAAIGGMHVREQNPDNSVQWSVRFMLLAKIAQMKAAFH